MRKTRRYLQQRVGVAIVERLERHRRLGSRRCAQFGRFDLEMILIIVHPIAQKEYENTENEENVEMIEFE